MKIPGFTLYFFQIIYSFFSSSALSVERNGLWYHDRGRETDAGIRSQFTQRIKTQAYREIL
jgi:hypothetical protein